MLKTNKRQKHLYTSELELKSLIIRIKNKNSEYSAKNNSKINRYIKLFGDLNKKKYKDGAINIKKNNLKYKVYNKVVLLSECTKIDRSSNERFGEIILLMIKSILTKPNFSGYTYKTDFYSDAIYKILKYMHNFNHNLISKISGKKVNAFAYISQIIFNSIIHIINTKKAEREKIKKRIKNEISSKGLPMYTNEYNTSTISDEYLYAKDDIKEFKLSLKDNIPQKIKEISEEYKNIKNIKIIIYYPATGSLTIDDYNFIKPYLKNVSVLRYNIKD